jgi:hypothetical protein
VGLCMAMRVNFTFLGQFIEFSQYLILVLFLSFRASKGQ